MNNYKLKKLFEVKMKRFIPNNKFNEILTLIKSKDTDISDDDYKLLVSILLIFNSDLSTDEERYLTEIFQIVFIEEGTLNYINPSLGESKYIDVTLIADDDWTEYNIVVKDDTTMDYISAINIIGVDYAASAPTYTQRIQIDNFGSQLTTGTLHKGVVQLEVGNESGDATGDCVSVLSEFYYTLKKNDVDEPA